MEDFTLNAECTIRYPTELETGAEAWMLIQRSDDIYNFFRAVFCRDRLSRWEHIAVGEGKTDIDEQILWRRADMRRSA